MREITAEPSIESERHVLGSILIDHESIAQIADWLKPEHFYRESHQLIYQAMLHLYNEHELPDQWAVCDLLRRRHQLDQIDAHTDADGQFYIGMLMSDLFTSSQIERHARRVKNAYIRTRLKFTGAEITSIAAEEEDIEQAVLKAEQKVYALAQDEIPDDVVHISTIETDFYAWLDRIPSGGAIVGVPTGFTAIDQLTGGLCKSDLIVLAGRPGSGKTSAAMGIVRNGALDYQRGMLVFSCEMSRDQLFQRLIAHDSRLNLHHLSTGQLTHEEKDRAVEKASILGAAPIYIDHTPAISVAAMRSRIRRTLARHTIDLIVVDHIQKMTATDDDGKRYRTEYQEVSEIARGLKDIARLFNLPVLALSQLSRESEHRADHIPQLSDLRASGAIEQEADIVGFIYRDEYYTGTASEKPGIADFIFAKHRNGKTTELGEIQLGFEASQTRFFNLEQKRTHASSVYGRELEEEMTP
jgi:replicative DNA helicase